MKNYRWQILNNHKKGKKLRGGELLGILLANRGLTSKSQKEEFLNPKIPEKIEVTEFGVEQKSLDLAIKRVKMAVEKNEEIMIYGDYDADGICSTAILWEAIYKYTKKVTPFIPDRFSEGYGINKTTVEKIKKDKPDLGLIITVDNGIVAHDAIAAAKKLGIDVIVCDHHVKDDKKLVAYAVVHSTLTSGAGLSWLLSREIKKSFDESLSNFTGLDLCAIGIVADQLTLMGINRSLVKYGIENLKTNSRPGLTGLFELASIDKNKIGTYEIGYLIAPRINAMGRLSHGLESLRLLCTTNRTRAQELSKILNDTNIKRQKIVDEVVTHAIKIHETENISHKIIVLSDESYHEGVIGLAASRLVEKFYLPSIVISKGKDESKGSARSIAGVNIIELIRATGDLIKAGGGHTMAAGFSIATKDIDAFAAKLFQISEEMIAEELLDKVLRIDTQLGFDSVSEEAVGLIEKLAPFGNGNPIPVFASDKVQIVDCRQIGADLRHLKLILKKDDITLEAVAFGIGHRFEELKKLPNLQIAYTIEKDNWNGNDRIQLKIKDIK